MSADSDMRESREQWRHMKDYALWVDDARDASCNSHEISRREIAIREPEVMQDQHGEVVITAVVTYGDTIHSGLVERRNYKGVFLPGFQAVTPQFYARRMSVSCTWIRAWAT